MENMEKMDLEDEDVSDRKLQYIFEHMTGLKDLSIRVGMANTNFGITGRHGSRPGVNPNRKCMMDSVRQMLGPEKFKEIYGTTTDESSEPSKGGFSISRLQNLERLAIIGSSLSQMDDTIFDEFMFPK